MSNIELAFFKAEVYAVLDISLTDQHLRKGYFVVTCAEML